MDPPKVPCISIGYNKHWDFDDTSDDSSVKLKLNNILAFMQSQLEPLNKIFHSKVI